jgi:hypothetical protein
MIWTFMHPHMTPEILGYIPLMISEHDPRPAREQFDANYQHGGGWQPFSGFTMLPNGNLSYPGDPPTILIAKTQLREETINFYHHSWVAIIQPDGSFEIARMD